MGDKYTRFEKSLDITKANGLLNVSRLRCLNCKTPCVQANDCIKRIKKVLDAEISVREQMLENGILTDMPASPLLRALGVELVFIGKRCSDDGHGRKQEAEDGNHGAIVRTEAGPGEMATSGCLYSCSAFACEL